MFKKTLIAAAVLAASTGIAFANGGTFMPAQQNSDNFYIGIGVSADTGVLKNVLGTNTDLGMTGVDGHLFGGYGITWEDMYYTGLEIFGQVSSNSGKYLGFNQKESSQWGIRFQPGIRVSDCTMLYGDIGWVRLNFKSDNNIIASNNRNGLQLGLGLQTMIANNVSLRGGWDWNRFQSFARGGRFTSQQYHLDLIYHFMA